MQIANFNWNKVVIAVETIYQIFVSKIIEQCFKIRSILAVIRSNYLSRVCETFKFLKYKDRSIKNDVVK